jgi:probable O-glycosylation ligase (exosortase A-associated)
MNPHRYAWGIARDFPVAMLVALATLIGFAFTRDKNGLPRDGIMILMILLFLVFALTTPFAFNREAALPYLIQVAKIWLMILVSVMLINNPRKLRFLLMVIGLSLGLIGIKGGLWALATGGAHRVYGPANTFIGDNNDVALAFCMGLPLLFYLAKDEKNFWLKQLMRGAFVMTIIATIFTYSRGGFLTLAAVGFLLMIKARYKALAVVMLGLALLAGTVIVPAKWSDRMQSIQTYQEDQSAMGRIIAWKMAINLALDRPLIGGGFNTFIPQVYARYSNDPTSGRDVHSSYFEMLGEQGFVGLGLFLLLIAVALSNTFWLKRLLRRNPHIQWARYYPDMLQVSIFAYMVGGAFLGRAYFDMFYQLVAAITITKTLVLKEVVPTRVSATAPARAPRLAPAPAGFRPQG